MLKVMAKYEMFHHESPKVVAATAAFVANYRAIGAALVVMEARVADCTSITTRTATFESVAGVPSHLAELGVTAAHMSFLRDRLRVSGIGATCFELLYQATVDGVKGADVARKCKGHDGILVVAREASSGWLYGGYMDCGVSDDGAEMLAPQAFVFSLPNPHGLPATAWRRGCKGFGTKLNCTVSGLSWTEALWAPAGSMLTWQGCAGEHGYQPRGSHGLHVFTGSSYWTASEVLIDRV